MAFGRTKNAGPAGAVTTSDAGTPYAAGSAPATPQIRTETRSRCCCCHVARGFLLTLVSLLLLGTLGTSIASLALGPNSRMTRPGATVEINASSLSRAAATVEQLGNLEKAPIAVHTGYAGWSDASAADGKASGLRSLGENEAVGNQRGRIVGYVVLGLLLLSAVAAFFGILGACCCGCPGSLLAAFAIPFGLVVMAAMLAYYFIVNRDVSKYAKATYPEIPAEKTVVQYPGWAWYLGAASGLLWLLTGLIGCCMPAKTTKVTTVV